MGLGGPAEISDTNEGGKSSCITLQADQCKAKKLERS